MELKWRFFVGEPLSNGIDENIQNQLTFYPNSHGKILWFSPYRDYGIYNLNGELLLSENRKENDILVKNYQKIIRKILSLLKDSKIYNQYQLYSNNGFLDYCYHYLHFSFYD